MAAGHETRSHAHERGINHRAVATSCATLHSPRFVTRPSVRNFYFASLAFKMLSKSLLASLIALASVSNALHQTPPSTTCTTIGTGNRHTRSYTRASSCTNTVPKARTVHTTTTTTPVSTSTVVVTETGMYYSLALLSSFILCLPSPNPNLSSSSRQVTK